MDLGCYNNHGEDPALNTNCKTTDMGRSWAPLPAPVASLKALRIEGSYRFFTRRAASRQPSDTAGSEFVYRLSLPAQLSGLFTGYVSHCPMGLPSQSPFLTSEALVGPRHSLASPELFSSRPTRAIFLVHLLADVSGTLVLLLFFGVVADTPSVVRPCPEPLPAGPVSLLGWFDCFGCRTPSSSGIRILSLWAR
jgi:hypothetical protein